jgi:hypothetical protein
MTKPPIPNGKQLNPTVDGRSIIQVMHLYMKGRRARNQLVERNVRNPQKAKSLQSAMRLDNKGPIDGLTRNPRDCFTFVFAIHSNQCPFNAPTLFEQFC